MSRNIIVVGYPKSGNTWFVRLLAKIINCPVEGFWNSDINEMAIEGQERVSEYSCYKAHHQLKELELEDGKDNQIIYLVRDPRDIIISGSHFFNFDYNLLVTKLFGFNQFLKSKFIGFQNRFLYSRKFKRSLMFKSIINGSMDSHYWCRVSWKDHLTPYLKEGKLIVKYEDLLNDPTNTIKLVLSHLNIERGDDLISEAVEQYSFNSLKKKYKENGNYNKFKFMRSGKIGEGNSLLTKKQLEKIKLEFVDEFKIFKY